MYFYRDYKNKIGSVKFLYLQLKVQWESKETENKIEIHQQF